MKIYKDNDKNLIYKYDIVRHYSIIFEVEKAKELALKQLKKYNCKTKEEEENVLWDCVCEVLNDWYDIHVGDAEEIPPEYFDKAMDELKRVLEYKYGIKECDTYGFNESN